MLHSPLRRAKPLTRVILASLRVSDDAGNRM